MLGTRVSCAEKAEPIEKWRDAVWGQTQEPKELCIRSGARSPTEEWTVLWGHVLAHCSELGVDDIALILQQNRMRWYGHVLRKDDDDWVKKCMEYEVEGSRPRGRPKRTWKEVVREDCQALKLNKEDAVDRCKWRKVIKEVR